MAAIWEALASSVNSVQSTLASVITASTVLYQLPPCKRLTD